MTDRAFDADRLPDRLSGAGVAVLGALVVLGSLLTVAYLGVLQWTNPGLTQRQLVLRHWELYLLLGLEGVVLWWFEGRWRR